MVARCYYEPRLRRFPSYRKCQVSVEWRYFSSFKSWMEIQDWKGKELDKDILGDGTLYSPEKCCFVENWLNSLFFDNKSKRGNLPMGVHLTADGKYRAQYKSHSKRVYLGDFDNPEEAYDTYFRQRKIYVTNLLKGYPDEKIGTAALSKVLSIMEAGREHSTAAL